MSDSIVLVDADTIKLVDADTIKLSGSTTTTTTEQTGAGGGKYDPSPQTRSYWKRESLRLAAIRDDDELLVLI